MLQFSGRNEVVQNAATSELASKGEISTLVGTSRNTASSDLGSSRLGKLALLSVGVMGLARGADGFRPTIAGARQYALATPALGGQGAFTRQAAARLVPITSPVTSRFKQEFALFGQGDNSELPAGERPAQDIGSRHRAGQEKLIQNASHLNGKSPAKRQVPIIRVETLAEFKKEVADEKDRMVAVKFYSPTCRACKAMSQYFKALALKYPAVKFVEVRCTAENAALYQGLGVLSVPFGHIYHPEAGLVEEVSINRKRIGDFDQALKAYLEGTCDLPEHD
jgi:thiol-disulfide isomerase/thioredoxin